MSQGVVIELRPAQAPRLGPWKWERQHWERCYLTGGDPGPIAVRAFNNRERGWIAFPRAEDGASLTPVIVPHQPRKTALPAIDAALGWAS